MNYLPRKNMTASIQREYIAGEVSKDLTKRMLLPEKIVKAHKDGIIYFHDSEYFVQPICRNSFIKLDEYGSCVWKQIDGKKTIYEIGKILEKEHKKAGVQLYERLAKYFKILETNKYVVFVNEEDK